MDFTHLGGWIDDKDEVVSVLADLPLPYFASAAPGLFGGPMAPTTLLYKAYKEVLGHYPPYPAQTIGDCFVAGTIVLGEKIQPIEKVQVGDVVWTGEGNLTKVVSTRAIETTRPLVRVHTVGGLPITCTADHKILVYRMTRVGGKQVSASYYSRAIGESAEVKVNADVISCYEASTPEWVAAENLVDTDFLLTPTRLAQPLPPNDGFRRLWDKPSWRRLLGFFLGKGHASGGTVEFAVSDPEDEARLVQACRDAGLDPKVKAYRPDCGAWRVRVHDRELVRWFRATFYDDESIKSFPGWAVGDRQFLSGLQDSDGFTLKTQAKAYAINSTSPSIINGTMASLASLGYSPTVTLQSRSKGTYANAKPMWRVTWYESKTRNVVWRDEQFVCRPVCAVDRIEGPATVYDIGVADPHHSFIANTQSAHNCVSQGFGHGSDLLACIEIAIGGEHEEFRYTSTEAIYGMARVDIGGGRINGDGAVGAWAAKAVNTLGTVSRDITGPYDGAKARSWGSRGVPADVKSKAADHKIRTVSLVSTWDELTVAIANGYPVAICSNQGFTLARDANGFCHPSGVWNHCMLIVGIRTDKPGACIMNSWGNDTPSGPIALDQPSCSFWAEPNIVARILGQGDSWAISGFDGYPAQPMPAKWSYSMMA